MKKSVYVIIIWVEALFCGACGFAAYQTSKTARKALDVAKDYQQMYYQVKHEKDSLLNTTKK